MNKRANKIHDFIHQDFISRIGMTTYHTVWAEFYGNHAPSVYLNTKWPLYDELRGMNE